GDGKPKPRASRRREKRIEDRLERFLGDARAFVLVRDLDRARAAPGIVDRTSADPDASFSFHRARRVQEKVDEHLLELAGIDRDVARFGDALALDLDPAKSRRVAKEREGLLDRPRDVRGAAGRASAREVRERADDRSDAFESVADLGEPALTALGVAGAVA